MDIKTIISDAARRYGVEPDVAIRIATIESRLDPRAQNKSSSAGGLFQFIDDTWAGYGQGKNKYDPYANADAGARFIRNNMNGLKNALGRDPTPGEIYMAHQQGLGGALKILKDPSRNAVEALGYQQVALNLPAAQKGMTNTITTGEFAKLWDNKINGVSTPLVTGGAPSNSMAPTSSFTVTDSQNPEMTPVTGSEIDTNRFLNDQQQREADRKAEAEREANAPGLLEGAGLAIQNTWSVAAPFRALGYQTPDPNFRLTPEVLKEVAADVPTEYLDEFSDAVSMEHADAIRNRIMSQIETDQKLASMGGTGIALQIGASLLDPGAIAATAAIGAVTGGLGLPAAMAARFGKLGTIGLGAAEGALGNLAVDIPLLMTNPTMQVQDLKYSLASGVVMGGAFSAFRKGAPMLEAENAQMDAVARQMQKEALDTATAEANVGGASAGAAQAMRDPTYRTDDQDNMRLWKNVDKGFELVFGRARFDLSAQLMKSNSPMVRGLGNYLVENAVGNKKGKVTVISASETQRRLHRVSSMQWGKTYGDQFDKFRKRTKVGFWDTGKAQADFSEQITAWQRADPEAKKAFAPEVQAAGAEFNSIMGNWWKMAREEGLTRSEMGAENYVPRIPHLQNARQLVHKFSYDRTGKDDRDGLTTLFKNGIMKAQPDIDPKLARKMGYAMVDRMQKLSAGQEMAAARAISGEDLDDFRAFLKDSSVMDDDEIEEAMAVLTKPNAKDAEAGGSARLKQRVIIDENFSMKLRDKHGTEVQEVKISDFYMKDANLLMHVYNRNMSGQIALARLKVPHPDIEGEWLVDGIRTQADFEKLIEQAKGTANEADKAGIKGNWTEDEANLRFAYNAISGIPNWDQTSDWARFLRMMRDFNFTRLMGQVGFSQIPEFGRLAGQSGIKSLYAGMPSFRQMIEAARTGKMTDEMADELDALVAPGSDIVTGRFHIQADEFGTPLNLQSNSRLSQFMDKADPVLHKMNRAVATLSLMNPINAVLQKWASRSFAVKFVRMAKFGDKVDMDRMKLLGLDEADTQLIMENIKKHSRFKNGEQKATKLEALGIKDWDGKAVAAFESALFRASRNMILENDVGQFAKWMSSPIGNTVMQFRSFTVGAWTRAMMQGINMRDMPALLGFMASAFLGGLVYAGQTHLQLIGDPDRERKLRERLTVSNLGLAAFQRTSESSLLPVAVDVPASLILQETVFDYRSSGLKTDLSTLFANPSMDLLKTAGNAVQGITTAIGGDDYSASDFRSLTQTLPGQRVIAAQWFFNWLASGLPQRELKD